MARLSRHMVDAMRRWLLRAGLVYLLASLAAGVVLGEFALQRGRLPGGGPTRAPGRAVAARARRRLEPVRLTAADGVPSTAGCSRAGAPRAAP